MAGIIQAIAGVIRNYTYEEYLAAWEERREQTEQRGNYILIGDDWIPFQSEQQFEFRKRELLAANELFGCGLDVGNQRLMDQAEKIAYGREITLLVF